MFRCLERMNYPQQFVDFIKILYQETHPQVQNNGHMSEDFLFKRGVREGCSLYWVQNDVFSYDILKDKEIKGFNIPGKKENLKLSQYADDTSFISSNFDDIPLLSDKFSKYEKATGCTLNAHKTRGFSLQRKKAAVLDTLRTTKIILSREDHCQSISLSLNNTFGNLLSNHEEADTTIIAHEPFSKKCDIDCNKRVLTM